MREAKLLLLNAAFWRRLWGPLPPPWATSALPRHRRWHRRKASYRWTWARRCFVQRILNEWSAWTGPWIAHCCLQSLAVPSCTPLPGILSLVAITRRDIVIALASWHRHCVRLRVARRHFLVESGSSMHWTLIRLHHWLPVSRSRQNSHSCCLFVCYIYIYIYIYIYMFRYTSLSLSIYICCLDMSM